MKSILYFLVGVFLLLNCYQVKAASVWFISCEEPVDAKAQSTMHGDNYTDFAGHSRFLGFTAAPPDKSCISKEVTIDASKIVWIKPIAPAARGLLTSAQRIYLQGEIHNSIFKGETSIVGDASTTPLAPIEMQSVGRPLQRVLPQAFGVEERAHAFIESDGLHLVCQSGLKPAGFLLKLDPPNELSRDNLRLNFIGKTEGAFKLSSNTENSREDAPNLLRVLKVNQDDESKVWYLDLSNAQNIIGDEITLLCPEEGGKAVGLFYLTSNTNEIRVGRATWIWSPDQWKHHDPNIWNQLSRKGINTIFITIPLGGEPLKVLDESLLVSFMKEAKQNNFNIWAVDGDPAAIRTDQMSHWIERMRAYASFNQSVSPESQLAGIQLDIEPYLNLDYPLNTERWKTAYIEGIKSLSAISPLPIEVVMPFWWANEIINGRDLQSQIAPWVKSICLMVYRSETSSIKKLAWQSLGWAAREDRGIRIALETGALQSERFFNLRRSNHGPIQAFDFAGITWLISLSKPESNLDGPSFIIEQEGFSDPTKVTLSKQIAQLEPQSQDLEMSFRTFPSFIGLAYHQLTEHMSLTPSHR